MRLHHATLALGIGAALLASAAPVSGQGEMPPRPAAPAARPWPPARTPDGQPDVQGMWRPEIPGTHSLNPAQSSGAEFEERVTGKGKRNPSRIVDPPDGAIPYQPWAAALQKKLEAEFENPTRPEHIDTATRCLVPGVPRLYYFPAFRIMQPAGSVVFVWDDHHAYRVIPLDGRPHVGPDVKLWMGDGRGRWEGNTLVVDTTNFTNLSAFQGSGEKLHLVERFTRVADDTLIYQFTAEDPTTWSKAWTAEIPWTKTQGPVYEWACHEGNLMISNILRGARVAEQDAAQKRER